MSDRLKHLVVYALQGRYDVEAVDTQRKAHAIELCREAASEGYDVVCAFGGDGTVNEAANGLAGTGVAADLPAGRRDQRLLPHARHPQRRRRRHRAPAALADDWRPRAVDLGSVNGRWFTFSAGVGLDASVVERVDRHPPLKARLGPYYFTSSAIVGLPAQVRRAPAAAAASRSRAGASTASRCSCRTVDPYTYFRRIPIAARPTARSWTPATSSGVVLERASPVDMPTVLSRALSQRPRIERHRQGQRLRRRRRRSRVVSLDERTIPVQVDGDYIGEHPEVAFAVHPGALSVVA